MAIIGPIKSTTGENWYAQVFQASTGKVRDVVAGAWDTPVTADWGDYDVALSEADTTGLYSATAPTGIDYAQEDVFALIYKRAGGSPATTDTAEYTQQVSAYLSNVQAISDDSTAATNAEAFFDGTGYAGGTTKLLVSVASYQSGQAPLQPTVAGRTLDVTTGGAAGVDWGNVENQSTPVNLALTQILTAQAAASLGPTALTALADAVWDEATTSHTNSGTFGEQVKTDIDAILADTGTDGVVVAAGSKTGYSIANNGITAASFASDVDAEILSYLVDDATRIDASALNTASGAIGSNGSGLTEAGGTGDHLTAVPDTSGTTTLLGRLTATRAGYLDNLAAGAVATAAKVLAYFRLLARSDSAIATDHSTELGEINANVASGAGDYANTADALEALSDASFAGPSAADIRAEIDANSTQLAAILDDTDLIDDGTSGLAKIATDVAAILVDTGTSGVVVNTFTTAGKAELQQEATDALNAYDPPTNAEMEARTLASSAYFDPSTDKVQLHATQPDYAPAVAGDEMDLVDAPNATAVAAIQNGLSTFDPDNDTVAHVTLVDTTTTNTDMRGTDGAALASAWTATRAGYQDKLNVSGTLAHSDDANTYKADVSGLSTFDAGSDSVTLTSAHDVYHADIKVNVDEANTQDEYTITWFKNGVRVTSGITSPTLQVVKRADGTDLIASTTPTQIASTGSYKHDATTSARLTAGEDALAIVTATIDSSTRTFATLVGRDSTA